MLELRNSERRQTCTVWFRIVDPFGDIPPVFPFEGLRETSPAPREAWIDTPRPTLQSAPANIGDSFRLCIDSGMSYLIRFSKLTNE
jgi:hypothetical protein